MQAIVPSGGMNDHQDFRDGTGAYCPDLPRSWKYLRIRHVQSRRSRRRARSRRQSQRVGPPAQNPAKVSGRGHSLPPIRGDSDPEVSFHVWHCPAIANYRHADVDADGMIGDLGLRSGAQP